MFIIFHVIVTILFSLFAGLGIVGLFCLGLKFEKKDELILIIPTVGYVFSQVLFFLWYYLFENSQLSLYLAIASICIVDLVYILIEKRKHGSAFKQITSIIKKIDPKILVVLLMVFILSSWQYLLIGEEHYYHSGNEDYFDGVNGGEAYLIDTPTNLIFYDIAGSVHFHAVIKYQYSSQAFWRLLLNVGGLDGFILQEIFCLLLTCIGIYWLVRYVFKGDEKVSLWISFWSVAAAFYFSTFMTGHIGSIMYVSVIPVFIGITLLWIRKEIGWIWLLVLVFMYYFIDNTYPGPVYFVLIPLALIALHERILVPLSFWKHFLNFFGLHPNINLKEHVKNLKSVRLFGLLIILLFCSISFFLFLWNYTESWRIAAIARTNVSWKITLFKEMFMVFWGIYPPGSTGTASILPIFISNEYINTISLIIAILLSLITVIALNRCRQIKERNFLLIYGVLFVFYLIVMRYFWGSPYYLYKFLYVHMFLIIAILLLWIFEVTRPWKIWQKKILYSFFILLGIVNIIWNLSLGLDFLVRPYHKKEKIDDFFKKIPKEQLSQSYLDIPNEVDNLAFVYIFYDRHTKLCRTKEKAQYIIRLNNVRNAVYNSVDKKHIVYDNGLLSIEKKNDRNNINLKTLYEPNNASGLNINWIGNEYSVLNSYLEKYISEVINYIKVNRIENKTYLDLSHPEIYYLIYHSFKKNNLSININPQSALYFIRINKKTAISDAESIYDLVAGEYTKWENIFLKLDYLPPGGRNVNVLYPGKLNFTPLLKYIINNGNSVYLDMPHNDWLYLFFEKTLRDLNVIICNNPQETELFLKYILHPPFEKYEYSSIVSPNSMLINTAYPPFHLSKIYWDVGLYKIPKENRIYSNTSKFSSVPLMMLTELNANDFRISINNLNDGQKYLRLLLSPGPSIDFTDFILNVSDDRGTLKKFNISSPQTLLDISLDDFMKENGNINLSFAGENLIGKSLLPLEERFLNYMMLGAELTENINILSPRMKNILNHKILSAKWNYLSKYITVEQPDDIIDDNDTSSCFLGLGWYNLESADDEQMRWVGGKPAEIVLNNIDKNHNVIQIDLEPGPGCAGKPLNLKLFYKDLLISEEQIPGRKKIEIKLQEELFSDPDKQKIIRLVPVTENAKISSDPRILNFRVFNISFKKPISDSQTIVDKTVINNISIGNGWYNYETYNGESFRWVGREPGEIILNNVKDKTGVLQINLEPGPGCGGQPLNLQVLFNDKLISEQKFIGIDTLKIDLSKISKDELKEQNVIKLLPITENKKIPSDNRILNFRVFNISMNKKN